MAPSGKTQPIPMPVKGPSNNPAPPQSVISNPHQLWYDRHHYEDYLLSSRSPCTDCPGCLNSHPTMDLIHPHPCCSEHITLSEEEKPPASINSEADWKFEEWQCGKHRRTCRSLQFWLQRLEHNSKHDLYNNGHVVPACHMS